MPEIRAYTRKAEAHSGIALLTDLAERFYRNNQKHQSDTLYRCAKTIEEAVVLTVEPNELAALKVLRSYKDGDKYPEDAAALLTENVAMAQSAEDFGTAVTALYLYVVRGIR